MTLRITYHLAGKRGRWKVWRQEQTEPVLHIRTKEEAVARARALAKRDGAQLLIYTQRGTVKSHHDYGRRSGNKE
jgi:hypothetical protein